MFKHSLVSHLYHKLHRLCWPGMYKTQTFTFYIPAPPSRKTGYREKEFDTILFNFINQGYDILEFNTQSSSNAGQSGMWALITVRANRLNASKLNFTDDFLGKSGINDSSNETAEGLYQIESENEEYNNIEY